MTYYEKVKAECGTGLPDDLIAYHCPGDYLKNAAFCAGCQSQSLDSDIYNRIPACEKCWNSEYAEGIPAPFSVKLKDHRSLDATRELLARLNDCPKSKTELALSVATLILDSEAFMYSYPAGLTLTQIEAALARILWTNHVSTAEGKEMLQRLSKCYKSRDDMRAERENMKSASPDGSSS